MESPSSGAAAAAGVVAADGAPTLETAVAGRHRAPISEYSAPFLTLARRAEREAVAWLPYREPAV